jgi:hypothetical protein
MASSIFGGAIDYAAVTVNRRRWFPFQPARVVMAPDGHLWINPKGPLWSEDFAREEISLQALFLHEMTHVLQAQQRGRFYLPLMRHPFCRYTYSIADGRPFARYGIEQQAEIVRHVFLLRRNFAPANAPPLATLERLLPFEGAASQYRIGGENP